MKYWFISHFDKRFTVIEDIREQIITDSTEVSKDIGQVFGLPLYWKPRVVMTPPLSSPGALQVVTTMVTCGNHSDHKVGFMIIVDFRYYTHGLVNIRITIAIHFHFPRFLESESLWYCCVQCITLGQLLWTIDQFLVTNKLQVCELSISMFKIYDTGLISSM